MSLREEKLEKLKKEKRNLYLMSALAVFEEKGFNDTRISDITDKAETSVGNFYNYFESKDEVFEELIGGFYGLMVEKLQNLFTYFKEGKVPPYNAIKDLFRQYIKMFKAKKGIALIFLEQMGGMSRKYNDMKNEILEGFAKEVEKIISNLVKAGVHAQNPKVTARVWTSTVLGIFHWWIRYDTEIDEEDLVDNLAGFLVRGTMTE